MAAVTASHGLQPFDSSLEELHDPSIETAFNTEGAPTWVHVCSTNVLHSAARVRCPAPRLRAASSKPGPRTRRQQFSLSTYACLTRSCGAGIRVPAHSSRTLDVAGDSPPDLVQAVVKKGGCRCHFCLALFACCASSRLAES